MSGSRLWLALFALLGAALLLFALVAPQPMARALDEEVRAKLERAEQAATLLLRLNARKWMDTAAQVATDAVLMESLEQATKGPADLGLVHKTVQERLRHFNEKMHVELLLATDGKGRAIARAGLDEGIYRDEVDGIPLVADGLRGLRGDDTWSQGGRLYRVAASPVMAHDHYVGVVVIGHEVSSELAQTMKSVLGVEVAFLLRGRVLASTSALPLLQSLPGLIAERAAELSAAGPLMIPVNDGGPGHFVVVSPLAGEAAEHQALCVLAAPRPQTADVARLLSQVHVADLRAVPRSLVFVVGGAALLFAFLGFLIYRLEVVRPMRRLADEAESVASSEIERFHPERHRGPLLTIARAINFALDRVASTRVVAEPAILSVRSDEQGLEGELRQVYTDFLATRVRCGERTEGVTYEKFLDKLRVNRAELISRHACKGVRFQVYVKDGKAALKATPLS